MRNQGIFKNGSFAGIGLIVAVLLTIILTGCASAKQKDPAISFTPPKQMSNSVPLPLPEPGPQPASLAPTGSLWNNGSGSLFADLKATRVGDVITITVSEQSQASKAATTTATRNKTFAGQFNFAGAGLGTNTTQGAVNFGPYSGNFNNSFKGDGSTSQTDAMTAYMTATVVDVLPNGNLLIRGSRWTKVNDELQQIVLEGVVRPADINRNNTVLSQNVAEAKIFLLGKGPVAQHQKPGWLGQVLDFISPF